MSFPREMGSPGVMAMNSNKEVNQGGRHNFPISRLYGSGLHSPSLRARCNGDCLRFSARCVRNHLWDSTSEDSVTPRICGWRVHWEVVQSVNSQHKKGSIVELFRTR